jgi:hypothetical protein
MPTLCSRPDNGGMSRNQDFRQIKNGLNRRKTQVSKYKNPDPPI